MERAGNEDGFTLIEMIVALVIFSLIAAAGVGLLRSSADTQVAVDRSLDEQGRLERIALLLQSDLGQAVVRPTTASDGGVRPAFVGTERSMIFVRGGIVPTEPRPEPSINRIEWRGGDEGLERTAHRSPDGLRLVDPPAILSSQAEEVRFEYRGEAGGWSRTWPGAEGQPFPRAVRMTISGAGLPPTEFVVALPDINPPNDVPDSDETDEAAS